MEWKSREADPPMKMYFSKLPQRSKPTNRLSRRGAAGMTLVELAVAMVVMFVAVGATIGSLSSFAGLEHSNRETVLATLAARRTLEDVQTESFVNIFELFNADPNDDPGGVGTAPGSNFAVQGLDPQAGDADGFTGNISFPTPVGFPGILRENLNLAEFDTPRDLNADGVPDAADHSGDYVVLPIRVRVEWRGPTGNRLVELHALLSNN